MSRKLSTECILSVLLKNLLLSKWIDRRTTGIFVSFINGRAVVEMIVKDLAAVLLYDYLTFLVFRALTIKLFGRHFY